MVGYGAPPVNKAFHFKIDEYILEMATKWYCWFSRDIMAAMLFPDNKAFLISFILEISKD